MRTGVLLAALIALAFAARSTPPARTTSSPAGSVAPRPTPAPVVAVPASLHGSEIDGALRIEGGVFVPDREAIRLFDYFLSTLGETDLAGVRALVAAEAPAGQRAAVLELFDDYVGYLHTLEGKRGGLGPREALAEVRRSQRERFGDDLAERLFGEADTLAEVLLDEAEGVPGDHEARLPPDVRAYRARMRAPAEVREEVEALRAAGATAEEIWAVRAARFGEDAADRLAALDARRSW